MLLTIGYEKADLDHFVGTLQNAEVDIVVDIRDRAQSRRPGFSKTALSTKLSEFGIDYLHLRELGDPKEGRLAARAGEIEKFRRIFGAVMETPEARGALERLTKMSVSKSVCLLCYERHHKDCHRKIVSDHLERVLKGKTKHLGVQPIEPIRKQVGRVLHRDQGAAA